MSIRTYPAATQLFAQGELADEVLVLRDSVVKLVWTNESGAETIVGLRWSGQFLATASCLAETVHPATAITLVPTTLERIARDQFLTLVRINPEFCARVLETQSREVLELTNAIGALACVPARSRLEKLLAYFAETCPKNRLPDGRLRLPVKYKDLAGLLAVRPEYLSRTLHAMADSGEITLKDEWIILHR